MVKSIKTSAQKASQSVKKNFGKIGTFVAAFPFIFVLIVFLLLVGLVATSNILNRQDETVAEAEEKPIEVETFSIGIAPKIKSQAEVEKSGVVRVLAQKSGIVQKINVSAGQEVWRGTNIAWLSTNYQGGVSEGINRQRAQENYEFSEETYQENIDNINDQRRQAELNKEQQDKLREINDQTEGRLKDIIALNDDILESVNEEIEKLEDTGADEYTKIVPAKQQKANLESSQLQLKEQLANAEYNTDEDEAPTELNEIQERITKRNLDIEEKMVDLNKELALLDLRAAQISESLMYPASPTEGIVERVFVNPGDTVNPGDLIAIITSNHNVATAIALVSPDVARQVSIIEPTAFYFKDNIITLMPTYISTEPTEGTLHSILFTFPDGLTGTFSDGTFVDIELPIGNADTSGIVPFIPIDAVYQTQDQSFVYVVERGEDNKTLVARTRQVTVGDVYGRFVEIQEGLNSGDEVILDRNVVDGDIVTTTTNLMQMRTLPDTGGSEQ